MRTDWHDKLYARKASFEKELTFWNHINDADYLINQLLFIDESHVNDRNINGRYEYSFRINRAAFKQLFSRGNRYTVTAALDFNDIVDYAMLSGTVCIHISFVYFFVKVPRKAKLKWQRQSRCCSAAQSPFFCVWETERSV